MAARDQQYYLDLLGRLFPEEYVLPLKDPGPGYELFQAMAKVAERMSQAVDHFDQGSYILSAPDGAKATTLVEFYRADKSALVQFSGIVNAVFASGGFTTAIVDNSLTLVTDSLVGHGIRFLTGAATGVFLPILHNLTNLIQFSPAAYAIKIGDAYQVEFDQVTVKAGTVVSTSNGGRNFVTTADAPPFTNNGSPTDLVVSNVPATAIVESYEYNVPGPVTRESGEVLPGDIDTIVFPMQDPPFGDPTIQVRQLIDATGGIDPYIDQLGADRGIARETGEPLAAYRQRIRTLPDTVSPDAMNRAIKALLAAVSGTFTLLETWSMNYQTVFDAPVIKGVATSQGTYDSNLFVFDDPREHFANRWLDENEDQAAFIMLVTRLAAGLDFGMAYDDSGLVPSDFQEAVGRRAVPSYDVSANLTPLEVQPCLDGPDTFTNALYASIYRILQQIKPAGVTALLELADE